MFLSPDPIGADRNSYRYAGGDPVNGIDPSGLECEVVLPDGTTFTATECVNVDADYPDDGQGDFMSFWNYLNNHNYPAPRRPNRQRPTLCSEDQSQPRCQQPGDDPTCDPADPSGGCYEPPVPGGCGQGFAAAGCDDGEIPTGVKDLAKEVAEDIVTAKATEIANRPPTFGPCQSLASRFSSNVSINMRGPLGYAFGASATIGTPVAGFNVLHSARQNLLGRAGASLLSGTISASVGQISTRATLFIGGVIVAGSAIEAGGHLVRSAISGCHP